MHFQQDNVQQVQLDFLFSSQFFRKVKYYYEMFCLPMLHNNMTHLWDTKHFQSHYHYINLLNIILT